MLCDIFVKVVFNGCIKLIPYLHSGNVISIAHNKLKQMTVMPHSAGLLAGAGVDVVVAEEDLRGRSTGGAVLGHVVRTDVDGLGMGAGHTVGLAFGGLDDQYGIQRKDIAEKLGLNYTGVNRWFKVDDISKIGLPG